jgi:diguanylate cyclase (GGDEF)-like protein
MSDSSEKKMFSALDRIAEDCGVAISVVDANIAEIAVSNNNSICDHLNPGPGFSSKCAKYCGAAYGRATASGKILRYECHVGLECRAIPLKQNEAPLVAIVGRAFVKTEKYREATERAITGDWREYPPNELFKNVLMAASADLLNKAARDLKASAAEPQGLLDPQQEVTPIQPELNEGTSPDENKDESADTQVKDSAPGAAEWRSFFGSILSVSYAEAAGSILEFIAQQFGFQDLVWLQKRDTRLDSVAAFGRLTKRRIKLGLNAGDKRLSKAFAEGQALELDERRKSERSGDQRKMTLFPIGVAGQVTGALAVLDPVIDEKHKDHIRRLCRSIAPQLEILRLRGEVERGDTLANAVRKFSESLKRVENDDLWLSVTQNAAEMLRAERSSLLVFDENANEFRIKAMLGGQPQRNVYEDVGQRVSRFVFSKKKAIAVADISKLVSMPEESERNYKTRSFLSSPISVGGKTIGVMNFTDRAGGEPFDKASLELFEAIAPQLAVAIDRASLKEKAGEFEQLSVTDSLTGLLNRRYIQERLLEEVRRSNRHGYPMSFMMLDVDHFKTYNDTFGHPAGDEALKLVGNVIRDTLRGADVAARFGGEEFAILLPQTTSDEARTIADRIRSNIENAKFPHRAVTVSIGVASCSAELCVDADLVSAADQALYEAKGQGRNRVVTFEEMMLRRPKAKSNG